MAAFVSGKARASSAAFSTLSLEYARLALDGVRTQLLGLPVSDGLRRGVAGGALLNPAPVAPPSMLVAGALRLKRARLLDALPTVLVLRCDEWETPLVNLLAVEAGNDGPGQEAYLDRLLDLLLIS